MTTLLSAPPAKAVKAAGDGHYYGYNPDSKTWYPLYEEGGTFGLAAAREAKANGLIVAPSVTGVIGVKRNPSIEKYMMENVAKACWVQAARWTAYESSEGFVEEAITTASHSSRGAMDLGTNIHTALEHSVKRDEWDAAYSIYVDAVHKAYAETGIAVGISAEECVGSILYGVAGKADIVHEASMTIGDIKTRGHKLNKVKASRVPTYRDSDQLQVAALGYMKWGNQFFLGGRGIVFGVSTTQPGLVTPHVFEGKDLVPAFECFLALNTAWRYIHNFDPRVQQ